MKSRPSVDIESEFIGKPVGPRKCKEKRNDVTDEIERFLKSPFTMDSVKYILLRVCLGPSDAFYSSAKIDIYRIHKEYYLIKLGVRKITFPIIFVLGPLVSRELIWLGNKNLESSSLRGDLVHAIKKWLSTSNSFVDLA